MEVPAGERWTGQGQQDAEHVPQLHSCVAQKLNVECDRTMATPCPSLRLVGVRSAVRPSFRRSPLEQTRAYTSSHPIPLLLTGGVPTDTSSGSVRFRITLSRITPIAASADSLKDSCAFFSGERFPRSRHQSIKRHLHDPNTMQREYPIP